MTVEPREKRTEEPQNIECRMSKEGSKKRTAEPKNIECRRNVFCLFYKKRLGKPTSPNWLRRPGAKPPFHISELIFEKRFKRKQKMTEEKEDKTYDLEDRLIGFHLLKMDRA
jgi:hypothetical protein